MENVYYNAFLGVLVVFFSILGEVLRFAIQITIILRVLDLAISRDRRILRSSRLRNWVLQTLSFQNWCFLFMFDPKFSRYDQIESTP